MKKFSVSLVEGTFAYTKEYDEHTAFGFYRFLIRHGEVAILSDDNGSFLSNCAELPEYHRVYDELADTYLEAYEKMYRYDNVIYPIEGASLAEMLRLKHHATRRKMKKDWSIHNMRLFGIHNSFSETFGRPLDPNRIAIIPNKYITVQSDKINIFKRVGTIRKEISNGLAFNLSNHLVDDAVVFPSDFDAVCEKLGCARLYDVWGNEHNIEDLDVILTASCCSGLSFYKNWENCLNSFNKYGAKFYVYNVEHALPCTPTSYLKNLSLLGNVSDSLNFADKAKNVFEGYKEQKKAIELLPAAMRHVVHTCPSLLSHWFVDDVLQDRYTNLRTKVLDDQIPDIGYTSVNAPDMVAFWQHAFGKKVKGILHAGQCLCTQAEGRAMDVTFHNDPNRSNRLPGANYAHTLFFNAKDKLEGYEAFFMGSTVYLNNYDLATLLQYKFSGYHPIFWSQDRDLINLVRQTNGHFGLRLINLDPYEFRYRYNSIARCFLPDKIEVEGVEYMSFNVNVLMNDPLCEVIPGLLGIGSYNKGTGKFNGEGLFASLAFRNINNNENIETLDSDRYAEAYLELEEFATQNSRTMADVCDNVTRWLFSSGRVQTDTKKAKALYDLYFGVFGDMVAFIAKNKR